MSVSVKQKGELAEWRTRIDELKQRVDHLETKSRDRLQVFVNNLEALYTHAKQAIRDDLATSEVEFSEAIAKLRSSWEDLSQKVDKARTVA
jgi:hypothetical protein